MCPEITNILQETHLGMLIRENFQTIVNVICEKQSYAAEMWTISSIPEA